MRSVCVVVGFSWFLIFLVDGFLVPNPGRTTRKIHFSKREQLSLSFATQENLQLPSVWIEEAGEEFVDEDENLEEGEVCLRSVKAFATPLPTSQAPRFLCAGALVQRPPDSHVCDAWTADSILDEGGPNLQLQGAHKVLDDLVLFHLDRHSDNTVRALQTLVVRCGSLESEFTCASYRTAISRGFRPLQELLRESSIYVASFYHNDFDGLVLDPTKAKKAYKQIATIDLGDPLTDEQQKAAKIYTLLPDEDTVRRCTIKRFTSPGGQA